MNAKTRSELKKTISFELWRVEDKDVLEFWDRLADARMRTPFFLTLTRALIAGDLAAQELKINSLIELAKELSENG